MDKAQTSQNKSNTPIEKPAACQAVSVSGAQALAQGVVLKIAEVSGAEFKGHDLLISFTDGASITITDAKAIEGSAAELGRAPEGYYGLGDLLQFSAAQNNAGQQSADQNADACDVAQASDQIAQIEPAAGQASELALVQNNGFSFQDFSADLLGDVGALGALGLLDDERGGGGAGVFSQDVLSAVSLTNRGAQAGALIAAGNAASGPVTVNAFPAASDVLAGNLSEFLARAGAHGTLTGDLGVDFGGDGPGTIGPSGSFSSSGSIAGGVLSSNGVQVAIQQTANGYTGMAGAQTVFTLTIDPQTGAYVFTLFAPLDHADASDPQDVIDLTFGFTVIDSNGDQVNADITVGIVDYQSGGGGKLHQGLTDEHAAIFDDSGAPYDFFVTLQSPLPVAGRDAAEPQIHARSAGQLPELHSLSVAEPIVPPIRSDESLI